ncbi:YdaS family helix-turn-helix protein [uncultured Sphingobium sp.]|uniref:transcriptional regulator n=1 Tax=uncultured Sphingobium sp. TaxID=316087 RepID=UPI0032B1586D
MAQSALHRAVEAMSSQSALARAIGTSQQRLWNWLDKGKPIPAEFVLKTEKATGIPRHELRPDIYPAPTASSEMPPANAPSEEAA